MLASVPLQPAASSSGNAHPASTTVRATRTLENDVRGDVDLFVNDDGYLEAHVSTERLYLRSVGAKGDELSDYQALFACPAAMQRYATGLVRTPEQTTSRYATLVERWRNKDPFSSLTARLHEDDAFVGQVTLGRSGLPGRAELAAASLPQFWRNGLASEGAQVVVSEYAPKVVAEGYLLDGEMLEGIYATARPDNPGSYKTLERFGFGLIGQEVVHGAPRFRYLLELPTPQGQTPLTKRT